MNFTKIVLTYCEKNCSNKLEQLEFNYWDSETCRKSYKKNPLYNCYYYIDICCSIFPNCDADCITLFAEAIADFHWVIFPSNSNPATIHTTLQCTLAATLFSENFLIFSSSLLVSLFEWTSLVFFVTRLCLNLVFWPRKAWRTCPVLS